MTYKTTCPHCSASFKITEEQLNLHHGKARCGNCSNIFQASDFITPVATSAATNTQPDHTASQQSVENNKTSHDIDGHLNDLFDDDSLKRHTGKTQEIVIPEDALIDDNLNIEDDADEASLDDLGLSSLGSELSSEFENTQGNFSAITDHQLEPDDDELTEKKWIENLLSEDMGETPTQYNSNEPTSDEQPEDLISFLEDIGANTAQFSAIRPEQLTEEMATDHIKSKINQDASSKSSGLVRSSNKKTRSTGQLAYVFLWGFLSLLLLGTLAGQYFYFNFDTLARDANQRPTLEKVCGMVGCELPMLDASKIGIEESRHFQDSTHPNWTRIKFVLKNNAEQPLLLPNLKVSFVKKGDVIGENIIKPTDYLVNKYKRLPRSQPIDAEILIKIANKNFDQYSITPMY